MTGLEWRAINKAAKETRASTTKAVIQVLAEYKFLDPANEEAVAFAKVRIGYLLDAMAEVRR